MKLAKPFFIVDRYRRRVLVVIVLALVIAAGATGCTTKYIKPEVVTTPTEKYGTIAIGEITMEDKLYEYLAPFFRRGLVQELNEQKAFEKVLDPKPETLTESSLLLSGRIKEVDKGSTTLRWLIGFGAGSSKASGVFEISDSAGVQLLKFEAKETYAGGAGIGGADYLDIEDLITRFGKTVAERTVRWSRGEKISE